jgi:hypothetical protein
MSEKYIDHAADALAREIDDSILTDMLIKSGWTTVPMFFTSAEQAVDTTDWLYENCTGKWRRHSMSFFFENSADAEWFILKHKR